MNHIRPRIAVTGKAGRWAPGWWCTALAIRLAGGRPVRARADRAWPSDIDGVVIGGGDDIATDLYGARATPGARPDHRRDAFELAAVRRAIVDGRPVLGICRGAQLLNVACGGSLHTDITPRRRATAAGANPLPCKPVALRPNTRLASVIGRRRLRVNGLHHQAIARPGHNLVVVARDADGFAQAIESRRGTALTGVQWHPEYLLYHRAARRLFRQLVAAAGRYLTEIDATDSDVQTP